MCSNTYKLPSLSYASPVSCVKPVAISVPVTGLPKASPVVVKLSSTFQIRAFPSAKGKPVYSVTVRLPSGATVIFVGTAWFDIG